MPSGNLVTKDPIDFDIGMWQHKTYIANDNIRAQLRSKWCSKTINIIQFDDEIFSQNIVTFLKENDFGSLGRDSYYIYCLSFSNACLTIELIEELKRSEFIMSRYVHVCDINDNCIYINDLSHHLLSK